MAGRTDPLDTATKVVTPENIAFEYRLAGPFARLVAFAIDWFVILVIIIALTLLLSVFQAVLGLGAVLGAIMLLALFVLTWFYGGLFEAFWNGVTPGKAALRLRVISIDGRAITGLQAIARNILRFADLMPFVGMGAFFGVPSIPVPVPLFLAGFVTAMVTRDYRRLGDLVSGTMVISEQREWRPHIIHVATPEVVSLAGQIPDSFSVSRSLSRAVARYVERRSQLGAARRNEIARHLYDAFRSRYRSFPSVAPDLFLLALYYRTFIADRDRDETFLEQFQQVRQAPAPRPPSPFASTSSN